MLRRRTPQPDPKQFQALVREHIPSIRRYAYAFSRDWSEADDLAQEALIKAFRAFGSFEGRSSVATWLYSIARNVCHDHARSRATAEQRKTDALDDAHCTDSDDAERLLDAKRSSELLWLAVKRLEPDYRSALVLFEIEGLSYDEIAAAEGIPIGTVRSRLARARERLSRLIAEDPRLSDAMGTSDDGTPSIPERATG